MLPAKDFLGSMVWTVGADAPFFDSYLGSVSVFGERGAVPFAACIKLYVSNFIVWIKRVFATGVV